MNENFKINIEAGVATVIIPQEKFKTTQEVIKLSENPVESKRQLTQLGMSIKHISYGASGFRKPYVVKHGKISTIETAKKHIDNLMHIQNELKNLEGRGFDIENKKEFLSTLRAAKKNLAILEKKEEREILERSAKYLISKMSISDIKEFIERYS